MFNVLKIVTLLIILALITGEVMCIVKLVKSDFKSPYKREIIYGLGTITGLGSIIGYLNIPDTKE